MPRGKIDLPVYLYYDPANTDVDLLGRELVSPSLYRTGPENQPLACERREKEQVR